MKSKPFLIAVAAFAVTASGVQAYGSTNLLEKAGLNEKQIGAFEVAREKRQAGDLDGARDALLDAGIDEAVLKSVHEVSREQHDVIRAAILNDNYEAFIEAAKDLPLATTIDSEAKFKQLVKAHTLRETGHWKEANALFEALGLPEHKGRGHGHMGGGRGMMRHHKDSLTPEQHEAFRVAHEANDRDTMRAILDEAGFDDNRKMR